MKVSEVVSKEKLQALKDYLKELGSLAVGFSGGVDSTFLLKVAHDVLGEKAIAVTCSSNVFSTREKNEADEFCKKEGIKQIVCNVDALAIPGFEDNPKDRCYHCKKEIFTRIQEVARKNGIEYVAEGSNMDDLGDYRPGLKAVEELGVTSPLRTANLYKDEIRFLSRELNLPTWEKPSFACLASRFVYGEKITSSKLSMVEQAEEYLKAKGLLQFRVRIHGNMARIEVLPENIGLFLDETYRLDIHDKLKAIGFDYVTLDLKGYRTGSMNETIINQGGQ
ncbi:MAG: ATP-dependent sacrificial sulfur transferase LarE [Saccharofermentans sp.]|nr:ATP-dependent sacrificial sulfur transferase LarE [Saccharofermentans sp.]